METGQVIAAVFFAVAAGFLACIAVELSCGSGGMGRRAGIGVVFALVDLLLFVAFMQALIGFSIASGPTQTASGPGSLVLFCLAAWIVPAGRLWWLKRRKPPST